MTSEGWVRHWLRVVVLLSTMATVLVPALVAPARTISVPTTLARSLQVHAEGRLAFGFAPTHVAFSWKGDHGAVLRYRVVDSAGITSRWMRVREAHDLETETVHYSAVLSIYGATKIEWEPRAGASVTDVTLDYLNTLDGPRREVTIPALAHAEAKVPNIVTRAEWGADESLKSTSGGCRRVFYKVQQLFVHHTAGTNFDNHPKATMRAIYWYHTARRGWCDVGYNFVIAPNGTIFEGRWARTYQPWETHSSETRKGKAVAGAHVANYNSGSVGVSMMGNFSEVELPPDARRSLAELLAWEADRHDLDPQGVHTYRNPETGLTRKLPFIAGHRDAGSTECPGNLLYGSLREVRRDTAAVIGADKPSSNLTFSSDEASVSYGEPATFSGTLTDAASGTPLVGKQITIYRRDGSTWSLAGEAATSTDGSFTFATEATRKLVVRAVYFGDSSSWGSDSGNVRVTIKPQVTIEAQGGAFDAAGIAHYPSGTTTVPLAGSVTPAHPDHYVYVYVDQLQADGTFALVAKKKVALDDSSAYAYSFPVPGAGSYRATTHFPSDGDHASAWSEYATFVVDPP